MTTKQQWWLVGGLALALVLIGVVALVARPTGTGTSGDGTGSGGTGSGGEGTDGSSAPGLGAPGSGSSDGSRSGTAASARCRVLADGTTAQTGQMLYSVGYTPLVASPDQKAPILTSRTGGEPVGTFTGKTYLDTRYFNEGNCFIQIAPHGGSGILSELPATVWVHPRHVAPPAAQTNR